MAKIPKNAQKVFEGIIFDVYHWPQTMFDGSVETFEMVKRDDAAVVVPILGDGRILLIEDMQPDRPMVLTFPGGHVEKGEEPLAAAQRELLEETGYTSEQWEPWQAFSFGPRISAQAHYYVARGVKQVKKPEISAGERISLRPTPIDDFLDGIISGKQDAYSCGTYIMQQLLQGKRAALVAYLTGSTAN